MAIRKNTAARIPSFVPFQEAVVFNRRISGDTFTAYPVTRARRKKINKRDQSIPPEILATAELVWQIAATYLPVTPQLDDTLIDGSGTEWVVVYPILQFNGQIYNLLTRRAV